MRTTVCSAIGTILIFFAVCGPASAMMCNDTNELRKLYEYAQMAEAAKSNNWDGMEACVDNNGTTIVESPSDIVELFVPKEFTDLVIISTNDEFAEFARLRPSQPNSMQFTVGCHSGNNLFDLVVDFSFKLFARTSDQGASFYLAGTEVTGTVVTNKSGEPITIIHSTGFSLSALSEIRANFKGEDCVFPLVQTTVEVLCEVLRKRGDSPVYSAFIEANGNSMFSYSPPRSSWSQSLTMVGHSLGGSAAQYVALNLPDECSPGDGLDAFEVYVFASPGLMNERNTRLQSNMLQNFLIDGDRLLHHRVFQDRFQLGRIALFTPPRSQTFCLGHFIDEVQEGICSCLRGEGEMRHLTGGRTNDEIFTKVLPVSILKCL